MNVNKVSEDWLQLTSISKQYRKGKTKANCNITASFYPGQITAIIGHNGAGKSTLLNQIIGIVKPDSGDITYQGVSFLKHSKQARTYVSMMPQLYAPLTGVTLKQSIESILHVRCISKTQVKMLTNQIISALDIEKWANRSGDKLSGGLQRLTSFAMAVVCPTPIILLDEPTNDVDPVRRKLVWRYMRKIAGEGHIVVVVTHNLLEVEQYADRFLVFDQGKLIKDAPTGSLNQHFATNTLIVGTNDSEMEKTIPNCIETKYFEEESRIAFTLSAEQVPDAVEWVLSMLAQGKIINYKLSPASLDDSYGGMINDSTFAGEKKF